MDNTIIFETAESFAVPAVLVDKYIDAPETEIKLLLFLLRHANHSFLSENIATMLKVDMKRLEEAFNYWVKAGIIYYAAGRYTLERPKISATDVMRYSADSIGKRIDGDEKIRFLYKKTEEALKKPLTTEDASTVLSMVDWLGLPVEVVAMIIQFFSAEKYGLKKMLSIASDWSENGINNLEKAEEYLAELQKKRDLVSKISRMLGISNRAITAPEKKIFEKWSIEYGYSKDIIEYAYEITVQNTGKYTYTYMDKIISSWNKKGFKTLENIKSENESTKPEGKKKPTKKYPERKVKIDTEAAKKLAEWDIFDQDE